MSMYYNEQVHELFQNAYGPIPYKLDCKCSEQVSGVLCQLQDDECEKSSRFLQVEALAAETVRT